MKISNTPADAILKEAGLGPSSNNLRDLLENNFLGLDEVIQELSNVVHNDPKSELRLKGIDTALKLHKVMDDDKSVPSIVINIAAGGNSNIGGIPDILIPRNIPQTGATILSLEA